MTQSNNWQNLDIPQEIRDGYYDLSLHSCTVATCLGGDVDLGLTDLYYELYEGIPENYLEDAFKDPSSLFKALVSTYLVGLINTGWPNADSGYRKIPVCWDEIQVWEDGEVFDSNEDEILIDSDAHLEEPWLMPPSLHWLDKSFIFKGLELLLDELENEETSEWPLALLLTCRQFHVGWRNWTTSYVFEGYEGSGSDSPKVIESWEKRIEHDLEAHNTIARASSKPEIPRYTRDEWERLLPKVLSVSKSNHRDIALHLEHCYDAKDCFNDGERLEGFSELRSAFSFHSSEWCIAYLDYQVGQSLLRRRDLDLREWLEVFASSVEGIRHGYGSSNEPASTLLTPESSAGILTTVTSEEYWAWRLGYVIAAGAHLYQELSDAATKVSADDLSNDLIDLMSSTFVGIALDLMLSLGNNQDWDDLEIQFGSLYRAYKHDKFVRHIDAFEYWDTDEVIDVKSPLIWLIKLGYVSYKRRREPIEGEPRSDDDELSIGRLERQWDESSFQQIAEGLELPLKDMISGMLGKLIPEAVQTHLSPTKEMNNQENLATLIGQSRFEQLPPSVKTHLSKAEEYFGSKDRGESDYLASQHYANATEAILRYCLLPKIKVLHELHRLRGVERPKDPRFLGEWEHALNDVLRIANENIFDYSDAWPEFDRAAIQQLSEFVRSVNTGRGISHEGVPLEMAEESRGIVLGTLAGSQSRGVLELVTALSGMST